MRFSVHVAQRRISVTAPMLETSALASLELVDPSGSALEQLVYLGIGTSTKNIPQGSFF